MEENVYLYIWVQESTLPHLPSDCMLQTHGKDNTTHVHSVQVIHIPWTAVIIWTTSGTAAAVFNKSLSLFHRKSFPETKSPQSHIPEKQQETSHVFSELTGDMWLALSLQLYSLLWDEAIVTTLLSKGWSLGVLFLVRPDIMLISLIRLSSNRNTDSFSWRVTQHWFSHATLTRMSLVQCIFDCAHLPKPTESRPWFLPFDAWWQNNLQL